MTGRTIDELLELSFAQDDTECGVRHLDDSPPPLYSYESGSECEDVGPGDRRKESVAQEWITEDMLFKNGAVLFPCPFCVGLPFIAESGYMRALFGEELLGPCFQWYGRWCLGGRNSAFEDSVFKKLESDLFRGLPVGHPGRPCGRS